MLRCPHRRCFLPVGTILKISDIPVKSVIFHHFFPKSQHMIRKISTNFSTKNDVHIISHSQIGNQYGQIVQICRPFLLCFCVSL